MDLRSAPWYYLHVEDEGTITQRGPIPFDELHVLYKDGGVEKDTFVWNEDPRGPAFESEDFFQIESRPELLALLETPLNTGGAVEAQDDPPTSVTQSLPEENADDAEGITATTVNVEHPREQASAPEPTTRPAIVPATLRPDVDDADTYSVATTQRVGGDHAPRGCIHRQEVPAPHAHQKIAKRRRR